MNVKLPSGKLANHRARYHSMRTALRGLAARNIAADDYEFLVHGDMTYVYWFEAR